MGLENVTFVAQLVTTNPDGATDTIDEGDDQLRLIKRTLVNSFPGITSTVVASAAELNTLDGYLGNVNDFNVLQGAASAGIGSTHIGYLAGATSTLQTQIDTINNAISANASLIASNEVAGTATTQIQFTGLDINTHNVYRVVFNVKGTGASSVLMYVNGDTTATNYYTQRNLIYSTTETNTRGNNSIIATLGTLDSMYEIFVKRGVAGYAFMYSEGIAAPGSGMGMERWAVTKTATVTNITQLDLVTASNSFDVGTKVLIYKMDY